MAGDASPTYLPTCVRMPLSPEFNHHRQRYRLCWAVLSRFSALGGNRLSPQLQLSIFDAQPSLRFRGGTAQGGSRLSGVFDVLPRAS